jgi:hypothetical protein
VGGELLTEEAQPTREKTSAEIFDECFPFYLAIGMSFAEYWTGDPSLVRYYRKAYRIKQDEINNNAWLQGLYIYDAVSTALFNSLRGFGKQKPPAKDYAKQPYEFNNKVKTETEKAKEVEIAQEKAAAWMENFVRMNQSKSQSHRARAN